MWSCLINFYHWSAPRRKSIHFLMARSTLPVWLGRWPMNIPVWVKVLVCRWVGNTAKDRCTGSRSVNQHEMTQLLLLLPITIITVRLLLVPGVMQLESNRFSVGKVSPLEIACFSLSSASRADLLYQSVHWITTKVSSDKSLVIVTLFSQFHIT